MSEKRKLWCFNGIEKDGKIYFSSSEINGIFSYNCQTDELKKEGEFEGEEYFFALRHRGSLATENKLIFVPEEAQALNVFDIETKEQQRIVVKEKGEATISSSFVFDNKVYLVPAELKKGIRCVDLETGSIIWPEEINNWISSIQAINPNTITRRSSIWNNKVYLAILGENIVLEWDLDEKTGREIFVGTEKLFSAVRINNDLWLVPERGKFIEKIELDSNTSTRYPIITHDSKDDRLIGNIVKTENGIYAIPLFGDSIQKLDSEERTFKEIFRIANPEDMRGNAAFFGAIVRQNIIYALPFGFKDMVVIETKSDKVMIKEMKYELGIIDEKEMMKINIGKSPIVEQSEHSLRMFCELL